MQSWKRTSEKPIIDPATRTYVNPAYLLTKSEEELRKSKNLTNQEHQSIKFDFTFSKYKIQFIDTLVYKDQNRTTDHTLQKKKKKKTQLIAKTICKQNLHICAEKSIAYKQVLGIRTISSEIEEYRKPIQDLWKWFLQKVFKKASINNQIRKVDNLNRRSLFKTFNPIWADIIPFFIPYHFSLPNTKEAINKY